MKRNIFALWIALFFGLLSPSSSSAQYDFFGRFVPEGTPVIDGVISPGEWKDMGHITLYKFFGEDAKIEIYLMWDAENLYLGAQIEDDALWVDSYNAQSPWTSTWDDDALKWEIDPDLSRDEYLQSTDRVFAINANGTATRFDKGNGNGGTVGIWVDPASGGIRTAAKISGTLNDYTFQTLSAESQKDKGGVVEIAIKWKHLFENGVPLSLPDGYSLGMNMTHIEDDTGGTLDPEYDKAWKRVADELTRFMGEEDHPENWAEFILSSNQDKTPPAPVSGLKVERTSAFSTHLSFLASGDNGATGRAERYDIRYATAPVSGAGWKGATIYRNNFRPQGSGKQEVFQIVGLSPQTTYYIGVNAIDERGNEGTPATTSFTTAPAASVSDKGYLTVDPGGRYFVRQNGETLVVIGDNQGIGWPGIRSFYDGPMWNDDLNRYVNFRQYDTGGIENGRDFLKQLSQHGVNTIRIIAEDLEPQHPVYLFDDVSGGSDHISFNPDTLDFLETLLDECAKVNINVIVVPFDTFFYSNVFNGWSKVPFSTAMGGPLQSAEDFFNPAHRDYLKAVLKKLVDTIGDKKNLLAWDIVNEFDSDEPGIGWNRASFASRQETLNDLGAYMKTIDPNHMVFLSSVRWDPKFLAHLPTTPQSPVTGNDAALILNNSLFDFNSTHMYYHDIRDPSHNSKTNPASMYELSANDRVNTIAPAARVKQGLQFYHAYSLTPKPYLCTEAGPIEFYTSHYDSYFTADDDNRIFHNMIWAYLASGEAGSGLRWPGKALTDHKLSDQMRDYQLAMKHFLDPGDLDFFGFHPIQIGQYLEISGTMAPVIKTGISDGKQGIIFLVNDERKQVNVAVSGASLTIPKLSPGGTLNFEFWDTLDATKTAPTRIVSATADASGRAIVSLPDFFTSQVIKFYCTDCPEQTVAPEGYLVTDKLWIRAVIHTVDKGPIDGVWQLGGQDTTARGDQVIWGYFYASPSDVSWGNANNPDVFVKIWIDVNGPVYVDYFHVSVPDIDVYTDFLYDGAPDQQGRATLTERFVEHSEVNGVISGKTQREDGVSPAGYSAQANPEGTALINSLRIGTMINTADKGPIEGVWHLGGQDTTARGDQVVWGYFYADPAIMSWGSANNPDLFAKIWFDVGGAVFVDFFHVSVPDIEVYSDLPNSGGYNNRGTTLLSDRFVEHRY